MKEDEKDAVIFLTSDIVDALVNYPVEELISHLTNDAKVMHTDLADHLKITNVSTRETVHKIIKMLIHSDDGYSGLINFLIKHKNTALAKRLDERAGKQTYASAITLKEAHLHEMGGTAVKPDGFVKAHSIKNPLPSVTLWNLLTANRSFEELQKELTNMCNGLGKGLDMKPESEEVFKQAFEAQVPLTTLGQKLLPMALHYQVWDDALRILNKGRSKKVGGPLDWKSIFLIFRYYLHPVKATLLYERFVEMNRPVPFMAFVGKGGTTLGKPKVFLRHFRNLFDATGGHRFVLSIGCGCVKGKSMLLNKTFDCQFELNSSGVFHKQSVDVAVGTKAFPIPFHILDFHGIANYDLVVSLSKVSSVTLVHANDFEVQANVSVLSELLIAISLDSAIVLIVRQSSMDAEELDEFEQSTLEDQLRRIAKRPVHVISVPFLAMGEDFETRFHSFVEDRLHPTLADLLQVSKSFQSYKELETKMLENVTACDTICRRDTAVGLEVRLLGHLTTLNGPTCSSLFPRSVWNTKLTQLDDQLKQIRANSSAQQSHAEAAIRLKMDQLQKQISGPQGRHVLLDIFIEVLITKDFELYEEFREIIRHNSSFSIEQFWQEVLLTIRSDTTFKPLVIASAKRLLRWGYPLEILNGDSLSIANFDCLKEILSSVGEKRRNKEECGALLCSVIGPQSSAKSTLVNRLFGSSFEVSAGRCTKGMHMSVFEACGLGVVGLSKVLVLDTEGLMCAIARDVAFDHQMTLMALALSNVVLINIKGELGEPMKEVLKVTFLALKQLSIIHAKPKLFFVLRDMVVLDVKPQLEAIERIRTDMAAICGKIGFQYDVITDDSFILLPSAINPISKKNLFLKGTAFVPNTDFSTKANNLLLQICKYAPQRHDVGSNIMLPFTNLPEWISHFNTTWTCVKQSGQMMHYKSLQEYFDRTYLSDVITKVCQKLTTEFYEEVKNVVQQHLLRTGDTKTVRAEFARVLSTQLEEKHKCAAETEFDKMVEDRLDLGQLKEEYRQCVKERSRILREQAESDFELEHGRAQAKQLCRSGISKIKELMDMERTAVGDRKVCAEQFESFWTAERNVLKGSLSSTLPNENTTWQSVDKIFRALSNLHPVTQRHAVYHSDQFTHKFIELQRSTSVEKMRDFVEPCTFATSVRMQFSTNPAIYAQFNVIVSRAERVINDTVGKLDSLEGVGTSVEGMYLLLNQSSDLLTEKHSCRLKVGFYSACLSYLFCAIIQQLLVAGERKVNSVLLEFDKNKSTLKQVYTQLVCNRFDDIETFQNLATLVMEKIEFTANEDAERALIASVQLKSSLTAQKLSSIAEMRQAADDIFLYITDFPKFLTQLFQENYDRELADLCPQYDARKALRCKESSEAFRRGVGNWKISAAGHVSQIASSITSSVIAQDFNRWSFRCFKAHLSQQAVPELPPQPQGKQLQDLVILLNRSPNKENLLHLMENVPSSFAICDAVKFCDDLDNSLVDKLRQSHLRLQLNESEFVELRKERLLKQAIGCYKTCPLCKAKCTNNNEGHTTHTTSSHRSVAFAGWRIRGTRKFYFFICTSLEARNANYYPDPDVDEFISFDALMRTHNWSVALHEDAQVENRNIFRWLKVRQRLCDHYDLDDNTPDDWLKMEEEVCPACQSCWNDRECGEKVTLSCGHYIGSNCYGRLLAQTAACRICPNCRKSLDW